MHHDLTNRRTNLKTPEVSVLNMDSSIETRPTCVCCCIPQGLPLKRDGFVAVVLRNQVPDVTGSSNGLNLLL